MNENLDSRVKREFDALIYSVLDSDQLTQSVINRLQARRRKFLLKLLAAIIGIVLMILAGTYAFQNGFTSKSSVLTVQSMTSEGGDGLIALPFTADIPIDGSDPAKSKFEFKVRLKAGQQVIFWTHLPQLTGGLEGKLVASVLQADGNYKDFQTYDIGAFTNRQEIRTFGDGIYRYLLLIEDPGLKALATITISILPRP